MVEFSVILPAHNEAENLPDLIAELNSVMTQLQEPFEIIVVDDGSTDATCSTIRALQQDTRALRLLSLDHNRGQSAALDAGLLVAEGTFLITMDADGQNPPKEILKLYESLGNHDAACGWRQIRKEPHVLRTIKLNLLKGRIRTQEKAGKTPNPPSLIRLVGQVTPSTLAS